MKIKSFTERPEDVAAYGPVEDESGERTFTMSVIGTSAGNVLARIDGITDREAAAALRGTRLYVRRAALPEPEDDEFYHGDLLGLRVEDPDGELIGTVRAVLTAGGGDALEIDPEEGRATILVPFTRDAVPVVDIAGGRVVVDWDEGEAEADP